MPGIRRCAVRERSPIFSSGSFAASVLLKYTPFRKIVCVISVDNYVILFTGKILDDFVNIIHCTIFHSPFSFLNPNKSIKTLWTESITWQTQTKHELKSRGWGVWQHCRWLSWAPSRARHEIPSACTHIDSFWQWQLWCIFVRIVHLSKESFKTSPTFLYYS